MHHKKHLGCCSPWQPCKQIESVPRQGCRRRLLVDGRFHVPIGLLDGMERNLQAWRETHFVSEAGCFYQSDTWDGGEDSISGGGCRVSINSVMASARHAWRRQTVQYVCAVAGDKGNAGHFAVLRSRLPPTALVGTAAAC